MSWKPAYLIHGDDHGRIAEQGTHRELLATGAVYRALHEAQFGLESSAG